ncbi:hypothetical protein M413DRAFT_245150 [Hebeloma cylindrosporum]|uniref:Uncharacterized protein n=1 Tax=Hebeloma cylindrosporum TaxID=76867 RepID=A0A0C3BNW5_HEBCY|nr:hypothetical protein M413DRAFT_245150 [Hebeloma cylindrosporum h7]
MTLALTSGLEVSLMSTPHHRLEHTSNTEVDVGPITSYSSDESAVIIGSEEPGSEATVNAGTDCPPRVDRRSDLSSERESTSSTTRSTVVGPRLSCPRLNAAELVSLVYYATIPSTIVKTMQRVFDVVHDGSVSSIQAVALLTTYNRPYDPESNPEGLPHVPSEFQTVWDRHINDDIGLYFGRNGTASILGQIAFFDVLEYMRSNRSGDPSPAVLWCARLSLSSVAWTAVYLCAYHFCSSTLKGAHVGAEWAVVSRHRFVWSLNPNDVYV